MYLLDTAAVSEVLKPRPDSGFMRWIEVQPEPTLALSALTVGEIYRGLLVTRTRARREQLQEWFDSNIMDSFSGRILPIDSDVAFEWSAIAAEAQQAGQPLPVIDSLIAATALAHDLTVVTRNVRDFERCGVPVLSPWSNA